MCGPQFNYSSMRENMTYHLLTNTWSTGGSKGFHKAGCLTSGFGKFPWHDHPNNSRLSLFSGIYCFRSLPFGITSSPEHFQRRMHKVLEDLPGVLCMMDDIIIF